MPETPRDTPPDLAAEPARLPSQPLRTASLSARKPTRFAFRPGPDDRAAIAAAIDLIDLPFLAFTGELRPVGRNDFLLEATLEAKAVQPCSVSLAPVPCQLSEPVRRRYDADFVAPDAEEAEMVDDEVDALPEILDIAAIATEALALALPLYPRAPGATLGEAVFAAPGTAPLKEADLKPFAGLAGLAERLKKPDQDPS
jgi:uncharacterized metal-binding protein YceD (DUF177 family)